jgi:mRNA interferase RelE/StbE
VRLDPQVVKQILEFLKKRLATQADPRKLGQALKGFKLGDFWKYRVGNFRIIVSIQDKTVCILILRIGDRKEVHKWQKRKRSPAAKLGCGGQWVIDCNQFRTHKSLGNAPPAQYMPRAFNSDGLQF